MAWLSFGTTASAADCQRLAGLNRMALGTHHRNSGNGGGGNDSKGSSIGDGGGGNESGARQVLCFKPPSCYYPHMMATTNYIQQA